MAARGADRDQAGMAEETGEALMVASGENQGASLEEVDAGCRWSG